MKTIVLAGGGTAGHIAPCLALLPYLQGNRICYVGEAGGLEERLSKQAGLEFYSVPCIKFSREHLWKNFKVPVVLHGGVKQAKILLRRLQPSVVFSKGGYAALPVALAAAKLHIPLVIHESDHSLGLSNKLVANKAHTVCATFPSAVEGRKNGRVTGTPLRKSLYSGSAQAAAARYGLPRNARPNLLVFGGSQGALTLNRALEGALGEVCADLNVLHVAGNHDYGGVTPKNYVRIPYCDHMEDAYAWADFVLCRAGAGTLTEVVALKKPALVVPLPKSGSSRGDQEQNAAHFSEQGYIRVLSQKELTKNTLYGSLKKLQADKSTLLGALAAAPDHDGTRTIAELLTSFL